ncbi:MAG: leucine-rich repeat domain-containing protein [Eubacteriales bacterium]|nr:leucine-rich repeat domain-containing protein [Eubacteriales bacterium]
MKKILSFLFAIALITSVMAITVSAVDIVEGNTYTAVCGAESNWTWDAGAKTLTYFNGRVIVDEVEVDDSWTFTFTISGNNLSLTGYADNCVSTLDDIIIPSFVKIDDTTTYAITAITSGPRGVVTIKSVNIYDGVTTINGSVFENCTGLEVITIPETVTSIGSYCFKNDAALHTVNLNAKVTKLGRDTFYMCKKLVNITLPDTLTTIEQGVFSACNALATINFPASLQTIGNTAFSSTAFTTITIPSTVTSLGTYAFSNCTSLTEAYIQCEGLIEIPEGLFQNSSKLAVVDYPDTVTTIGKNTFQNVAFKSFDFTGITTLKDYCFQYSLLENVVLPEETINLYPGIFFRCKSLKTVEIRSEGLTTIPISMFNECVLLTSVTWPDTVTTLGGSAFYKAGAFPIDFTGVTTVGDACFQWSAHTSYVIPECVTSIGKAAFQNNSVKYIIFEGKTAPVIVGTLGDRNSKQGLRDDAKITGKVYFPVNGVGYEDVYNNFFTVTKTSKHYIGANITSLVSNATGYTVGYEYNVKANIQDNSNIEHQSDKIMVALYNADDMLVGACTVSTTNTSADIVTTETVSYAKIFALDSIPSLKPLYEAHQVDYIAQ